MKSYKQLSTVALVSLLILSGCTNNSVTKTKTVPVAPDVQDTIPPSPGTKRGVINYASPAGEESMQVSVTTKNGIITEASATPLATNSISLRKQQGFAEKVSGSVVGKTIQGLKVDTISGASLTTGAFNDFLVKNAN